MRNWLRWIFIRRLCFGGYAGALIFFCLSVSPALLPRDWLFQGIVSGISVAIGYGLGSALSAGVRSVRSSEPSAATKRRGWIILTVAAIGLVPLALLWGNAANQATRQIMGMKGLEPWAWPSVVVLAIVVFTVLLLLSRMIRSAGRGIVGVVNRWLPRRVSLAVGGGLVVLLVVGLFNGIVSDGIFGAIDSAYSVTNRGTTEGFVQPASPLRSGSDASLVPWDTLGQQGRDFTGEGGGKDKKAGPTGEDIAAFHGQEALDPIRVYVGVRSADSLDARVDLALRELERTNAFEREIIAIYTPTGTGWVDERVSDSLEYIWGGDTAAVAVQYSYLPSWVSVLVDTEKAAESGRAVVDGVLARVEQMPEGERPMVVIFGESLGSFGAEAAFDDLDDMVDRVDGALLVGPTFGNEIRNHLTDNRDDGSPEWRPEFEGGRQVRFAIEPSDLDSLPGAWDSPRVVFLQNSSDPIAFFSIDLLWSKPSWLDEPRAPDANPDMFWIPVVTFAQMLADLSSSFGAPVGHGHRYGANVVDGWLAIRTPDGWTPEMTDRLRDVVGHE